MSWPKSQLRADWAQPEGKNAEIEEQSERRTTENVQQREPQAKPEPQQETGADAAGAAQADEEERRRRAQQGMSM